MNVLKRPLYKFNPTKEQETTEGHQWVFNTVRKSRTGGGIQLVTEKCIFSSVYCFSEVPDYGQALKNAAGYTNIKKKMWYDCQWDSSQQETKMTQKLTTKVHRTGLNNEQSPCYMVSNKRPRNDNVKQFKWKTYNGLIYLFFEISALKSG